MSETEGQAPESAGARELLGRIRERRASVAVIGQGFVGAPQAIAIARAGFRVVGIDRDPERVGELAAGRSPVPDVSDEELGQALASGAYQVTTRRDALACADVVVVCIPTPLTAAREPDLRLVEEVASELATYLDRPRLVVLESTVPPGTTRSVVVPRLEAGRRQVGRDFYLGFAPERLDPGNRQHTTTNIPRLVGGVTGDCRTLAVAFYGLVVDEVRPVGSPEIAELAKALENTFRFLNVSFVNEVAMLCDRLGCSVWEVIDAAATKPFAFLAHYPGPGVGGSCIPVVPHYLRQVAAAQGAPSRLIDAATAVNDAMPGFVVEKLGRLLGARNIRLEGASVLVLGVSYKPDVADLREAPSLPIIRLLTRAGARVAYHDPLVPSLVVGETTLESTPLAVERLATADAVVVVTLHSAVDRNLLLRHARFIFDTRNALRAADRPNVVVL